MSDHKGTPLGRIRNIGIIAHIDAGKTTTSERILFYSGKEHRIGEVHDGTAVMDFMQDEQERGITISSAATTLYWNNQQINLIDTPGHVDFTAEVERSLRVLDGAICVFCAVAGVQAQTETVWHQAEKYKVPRIAFINKMDRAGSDFEHAIEDIKNKLAANPLPLQIPVGKEDGFKGVINLIEREFLTFDGEQGEVVNKHSIPEELKDEVEILRQEIIEVVAGSEDELTEKYLENGTLSNEEVKQALRNLTISRKIIPVFCGSSLKNKGIQPLLDAVVDYLPSPKDIPPMVGHNPKDIKENITCNPSRNEKLVALAFKLTDDAHGTLTFLRVYAGELTEGMKVIVAKSGRKEKTARLWRMHANSRERLNSAGPGEIVAVSGFKFAGTGDTICEEEKVIELEPPKFPSTVISVAVEPKANDDRDKLMDVIQRLEREDPTFAHKIDNETGQLILSGMGELHLDVLSTRIARDYKVPVNIGSPRVSYREGIAHESKEKGKFEQIIAGKNNFAEVTVKIVPNLKNIEPTLDVAVDKNIISTNFINALSEGLKGGLSSGPLGGYPMIYMQATVEEAKSKENEMTEIACIAATEAALREAVNKAGAVLYEPVMALEVNTPEEFLGNIIHDLNGRRAEILEIVQQGNLRQVKAKVALAEMFGYATTVRGLSTGRANYSMEPCAYSAVPKNKVKDILGYDPSI